MAKVSLLTSLTKLTRHNYFVGGGSVGMANITESHSSWMLVTVLVL